MNEFNIIKNNGLLTKKEKSLPKKEQQKLIDIRIEDEKIKIKNDFEAKEREKRAIERINRKRKFIEDEEIQKMIKLYKEDSIKFGEENIDLSVFEENPELYDIINNLLII
jgi:hypothetical protein